MWWLVLLVVFLWLFRWALGKVCLSPFAPCVEEMKAFPSNQVSIAKDFSGPVSLCDARLTSGSSGNGDPQASRDGTVDVSSEFPRRSQVNGKFRVKRELMDAVQYSSVVYRLWETVHW